MPISEITPQLYIAAKKDIHDVKELKELDISLVVNAILFAIPPRHLNKAGIKHVTSPSIDSPITPIPMFILKRGVNHALPYLKHNKKVVIYCKRGRHRSVAIACSILIALGYSSEDAMKLVIKQRSIADPYAPHIRKRIEKFEKLWVQNEI